MKTIREKFLNVIMPIFTLYLFTDAIFGYSPIAQYTENLAPFWALIMMMLNILASIFLFIGFMNMDINQTKQVFSKHSSKYMKTMIAIFGTAGIAFALTFAGLGSYFTAFFLTAYSICSVVSFGVVNAMEDNIKKAEERVEEEFFKKPNINVN